MLFFNKFGVMLFIFLALVHFFFNISNFGTLDLVDGQYDEMVEIIKKFPEEKRRHCR